MEISIDMNKLNLKEIEALLSIVKKAKKTEVQTKKRRTTTSKRKKRGFKTWTKGENEELQKGLALGWKINKIARYLGRTESAVYNQKLRLK